MSALTITAVEALAARQFGVFTRSQALALGVGPNSLRRCLGAGRWSRVLPTVYRVTAVPVSYRQRAMAAVLWSTPDGLASHATAARLWGLEGVHSDQIHLCVPRGHRLRHDHVVVHSTRDLIPADRSLVHGIPATSPLRTVLDLAEVLDSLSFEIAVEDGLRRRLFSPGQLLWRANDRAGSGLAGAAAIHSLLRRRATLGLTDSGWEVRVARVLTEAGLPEPVRQLEIQTPDGTRTVDLAYLGPPVVAFEYDSDRWHSGVERRHRDAGRRNALRLAGCTVIEVTSSLAADPERLVRTARAALVPVMRQIGS